MIGALASSLKRRIRRAGGRVIRRAGLLPGGMPDGLGEDDQLLGTSLPHTVMVFFPDPPGSLYQIEQWYGALRELDHRHRVVVVLRDSRTARAVRRDSGLDCIVLARYTTMDDLLSRSEVKLALYVSHHPENFSNLRTGSMVHVSMMHGDSDKAVSVSHQTNAYDFSLVAGQAAVDRLAAFCAFFDAPARCITIGRPQLDEWRDVAPGPRERADAAPTVLYAPTWEGAHPSVAYGSADSHGLALVEAFLADGWRVIYRPHPLSGVRDPGYAAADRAIRARIEGARESGGAHRVDVGVPESRSFGDADLLVCDISGVAVDWLAVDRPFLITQPARPEVASARTAVTDLVPSVAVADVAAIAARARRQVTDDPLRSDRRRLVEYYLGDTRPGAATERFLAAVDHLLQLRDDEQARLTQVRQGGQ